MFNTKNVWLVKKRLDFASGILLCDGQVVAVDDFRVVLVTQDLLNLCCFQSHYFTYLSRTEIDEALGYWRSIAIHATDRIAYGEISFDSGNAGRKQTFTLFQQLIRVGRYTKFQRLMT